MAADFGLLVGRYNTATPALSTDKELRELRLDAGGRMASRLVDGNDKTISWFADGDAVNSGDDDFQLGGAGDRGMLILGKNDTDSNYQILRVNSDGSLSVSFNSGADVSSHSDGTGGTYSATDSEGEVALTVGNWVLVHSIAIASGKVHIDGFTYTSDKNTMFQLCLVDDTGVDGVERADTTEILDSSITTSASPTGGRAYTRALTRAGGTNIYVALFAKQLQAGGAGIGMGLINAHTTT